MSTPFVIENHLNEGYVHATLTEHWNTQTDTAPFGEAMVEVFDSADAPIWFIVDFTASKWSLTDAIFGANFATRNGIQFLRHNNMRSFIAVGGSMLVNAAAKGLSSPIFGEVPVKIVKTMDEALDYITSHS